MDDSGRASHNCHVFGIIRIMYCNHVRWFLRSLPNFSAMALETLTITESTKKRPRKRARKALGSHTESNAISQPMTSTSKPNPNRLFAPFRCLGLVTNHIPFVIQTRSFKGATDGPRVHILTCLGRSWALWEGGKMTLLFVGELSSLISDDRADVCI